MRTDHPETRLRAVRLSDVETLHAQAVEVNSLRAMQLQRDGFLFDAVLKQVVELAAQPETVS